MVKPERDIRFDFLRAIGLICIIFAHTRLPDILKQIRNFDVPLMVIVSGAVYNLSPGIKKFEYLSYVRKRLLRILAPTWSFLIFFFIATWSIFFIQNKNYPFSPATLISSFALLHGIGYVWIFRVFVLVALCGPVFLVLYNTIKVKLIYFLILVFIYGLYETAYPFLYQIECCWLNVIINDILFYMIPYGCLFGLGLSLPDFERKTIITIASIFFILFSVFSCLIYSDHFVPTNKFKYPPRLYYLSYSIFASLSLFLIFNKKTVNFIPNKINKIILFVGSSTMWIYLWHILLLYIWMWFSPMWAENFMVKFSMIFLLSSTITYLQQTFIKRIIESFLLGSRANHFLSIAFLK